MRPASCSRASAGDDRFPHGIYVDRDGNIWVTDANDNRPRPARGSGARHAAPHAPGQAHGASGDQVQPGGQSADDARQGRASPATRPTRSPSRTTSSLRQRRHLRRRRARGTAQRAARHGGAHLEVHEGRQVREELGHARIRRPANSTPHSLAFDSRGRLFVADRGNVRLQIFDQDGKFLEETKAFSRLSGIFIDQGRHALRRRF